MLLVLFITGGIIFWGYDEYVWIQTLQEAYWRRFTKLTFAVGIITVGAFVLFLVINWATLFIVAFVGTLSMIMATVKSLLYYHEIRL